MAKAEGQENSHNSACRVKGSNPSASAKAEGQENSACRVKGSEFLCLGVIAAVIFYKNLKEAANEFNSPKANFDTSI